MTHPRTSNLRLSLAGLAVFIVCLLILLTSSGCAATGGHSRWWNPLTWGANPVARVEARQEALAGNQAELVKAAQVETHKTAAALEIVPESQATEVARRTTRNAEALLASAAGPLDIAEAQRAREIARGLAQGLIEAERDQARAEATAAKVSAENASLKAELTQAQDKLQAGYARERALANRMRNIYWIAGGLAALWLLGNVLAVAARANPALNGVSHLVNGVVNPALSVAHARAVDGLHRVGRGMRAIRTKLPQVAEQVEVILDMETDQEHQQLIAEAA